jgi:hypothetical protein
MRKVSTVMVMILMCSSAWAYDFNTGSAQTQNEETAVTETEVVVPKEEAVVVKEEAALPEEETVVSTNKTAVSQVPAVPVSAQPAGSEAQTRFTAIENQTQWVAKLKKQLDGETSQLNEMRTSLAQAFGLNVEKLEKDGYKFDTRSGKIVEK